MSSSSFWVTCLALTLVAAAACSDREESDPGPVDSTSPAQPGVESRDAERTSSLVFIRGDEDLQSPIAGSVWVSDADGDNSRLVSPDGVRAAYVGTGESKSGGTALYYLTEDGEAERTLWAVDLPTGDREALLSYRDTPTHFYASVSPDGRYIAHTTTMGLELYDRATGTTQTLFGSGDENACVGGEFQQCFSSIAPDWSPDGQLLLLVHAVYEGGWAEVVDPFKSPPAVLTAGNRGSPQQGVWSPGSDAVCATGVGLAELSSIYLLESPEWQPRNLMPMFANAPGNPEGSWVMACDWLDDETIVFIVTKSAVQPLESELWRYDRATGEPELVATLTDATQCCGGLAVIVAGSNQAVTQGYVSEPGRSFWSQPALVDVETGSVIHILEPGDVVVDSFVP